ncbi:hypothetical protein SKAU_G00046450 [Synaphobranchus kaupii]|uniref:Uncharacterized protein n=1 Tax=Synaphobranchus kaupii TaxID=118154 RepID=A0A9Q1G2A4_SYNKA|nr:hypothetical protein SKAU_G00046450 [Synaphobranchus kaupii]
MTPGNISGKGGKTRRHQVLGRRQASSIRRPVTELEAPGPMSSADGVGSQGDGQCMCFQSRARQPPGMWFCLEQVFLQQHLRSSYLIWAVCELLGGVLRPLPPGVETSCLISGEAAGEAGPLDWLCSYGCRKE